MLQNLILKVYYMNVYQTIVNCPIRPLDNLNVEGLVRLWAHEALRLFQDRLVEDSERRWTNENIDSVALKHFPSVDREAALIRPILYSNWLSKDYVPVDRNKLRDYVKARLKVNCNVTTWLIKLCGCEDNHFTHQRKSTEWADIKYKSLPSELGQTLEVRSLNPGGATTFYAKAAPAVRKSR